jgi:KDO2-lipid IV(A) lauroyltransferase
VQRPPLAKRLKRALRYGLVRVALALVGSLPVEVAGRWGWAFGGLAFRVARTERSRALDGLRRAFPDLTEAERTALAEQTFRHLGRSAFELACVRKMDPELDRWVEWPQADRQVLEAALARGKGVLFVSGHVGNWELLARRVAMAGYPCQTIAKETTDPRLTRLVEAFRSAGKLKSIWRGQDGAAKAMLKALKGGEILGMLIDQDTKVQSVHVPFFGHPASTPRAAADLALRTGAAVVVGFCQRGPDGRYRVTMKQVELPSSGDREADAVALTARMTWEIEQAIRREPAQWVWMHRRWKTQPS